MGCVHPAAYSRFPAGIRVRYPENGRRQMPDVQQPELEHAGCKGAAQRTGIKPKNDVFGRDKLFPLPSLLFYFSIKNIKEQQRL